jgi:glycosyltransferase involved in cell wall biosynthesis
MLQRSRHNMLFSVIIPVYNREHLIEETLDSVFRQTFDDYEVIVVDDGSTDQTVDVVKAYPDPVRLIQQENTGPGAARNTGIKAATGEYIAFLDSDDRWFPWTLETYRKVIAQHQEPALISGVIDYFSSELSPQVVQGNRKMNWYRDFLVAARKGIYVSTGHAVIKRTSFSKVKGFATENINAEDHDLVFQLGTAPGFVDIQSPPTVGVRRHDIQATGDTRKTWEGLMYILDKERKGAYPGGSGRRWERRYLMCQHVRSASLALLQQGLLREAWVLYRRTLPWQLRFGRLRYAGGFPGLLLKQSFTHATS